MQAEGQALKVHVTHLLRNAYRQAVYSPVEQLSGGALLLHKSHSVISTGRLQAHIQTVPKTTENLCQENNLKNTEIPGLLV